VSKSSIDAYAWYSLAAEKGDQGAQDALQRVEATMSVRELGQAKSREKTIKRSIRVPS
jgi:TPR repeat protein